MTPRTARCCGPSWPAPASTRRRPPMRSTASSTWWGRPAAMCNSTSSAAAISSRLRWSEVRGYMKSTPRVGWVEVLRNPSRVLERGVGLMTLLAFIPLAAAQSIEEKAQACAACHGEAGIPPDRSWPVIWGQHQGYLYLQLRDFKSGSRKSDVMGPIAEALERDDMLALGLYFSQKKWPDLRQPRAAAGFPPRWRRRARPPSSGRRGRGRRPHRSRRRAPAGV